ncbi:hypothetical protein DFP72DRAFT_872338 [Ephemerocybe angulata]|uniref:Uncharacterized protein n=1 Tax=Ephemerocybe angulata TaxID=980116 RepID=A0A8H6IFH4_9AGAR|nr:hypothetical protein DFP72DRAFT_872338 [Tulosesus angulatus]
MNLKTWQPIFSDEGVVYGQRSSSGWVWRSVGVPLALDLARCLVDAARLNSFSPTPRRKNCCYQSPSGDRTSLKLSDHHVRRVQTMVPSVESEQREATRHSAVKILARTERLLVKAPGLSVKAVLVERMREGGCQVTCSEEVVLFADSFACGTRSTCIGPSVHQHHRLPLSQAPSTRVLSSLEGVYQDSCVCDGV